MPQDLFSPYELGQLCLASFAWLVLLVILFFSQSEILISLHAGHVSHKLDESAVSEAATSAEPPLASVLNSLRPSYQPIIQHSFYQFSPVMDYQPQVINFNLKGLFPEIHQVPEPN